MNIEVGPPVPSVGYRKIAIAGWGHPRDPQVYSWADLSLKKVGPYLKSLPHRPTITHYTAKVLGDHVAETEIFNRVLIRGRLRPRLTTDAFITTLVRGRNGYDLSGYEIADIPGRSLPEIAEESARLHSLLRKDGDPAMRRANRLTRITPQWLLNLMLPLHAFIGYTLNWDPRFVGLPKDAFGSFMISNVGALGLEHGLIPLSPYSRVPLIVGIGKPRMMAVVRSGEIVAEEMVRISFTFDHRIADGIHGAIVLKKFITRFENPQ
jgi:pyruvate dehydrogenase E2 component (dihydrolipoamide acetyltransferase)